MALVTRADSDGIARLTLNDPDRLNPLSDGMIAALQAELDRLAEDRTIRAVILAAAGRAFCAGHDLREMQARRAAPDGGAAGLKDLFDRCARMMLSLRALPQPVIAEVQGAAVAAGCQLVASCDLALAAEGARFGVNGVNIGLFCSTPMVALTRAIPPRAAFEMLVTGRMVPAEEAARLGLILRAVPAADLTAQATALAATIAEKLPVAVRMGKRAFYDQAGLTEADAYALAGRVMVANMLERDTDEGIDAFLAKRRPDWAR
jgi:enoyl-CoA hydratase/carnithine racemase